MGSLKSKRPSKKYKKAPASEEVASDPLLQGEEKKVAVQLRVRVADMKEPSDDEDDDEEIQCLVEEEPVKSTASQEMKISMTSSKTEAITQKSESGAKPAGIALPITEMTDDWMDDDMAPGEMDSDTESENLKEEVATKSPQTQDVTGERKPAVAGIALPITEMTDDWMDDGEALGSMDSEDEEEPKVAAESEKGVQEKKPESEIQDPTQTTDRKSATDNVVKAKTTGIALPTSEMTFDWMDDDTAVGSIESEEEETDKKPEDDIPAVAPVKETKPAGIALPITEMTDDWMDDDVAIGSIDSDEDEEVPNTDMGSPAKTKDEESPQKMEINKSDAKKASGIALPITEMTDDSMLPMATSSSIQSSVISVI